MISSESVAEAIAVARQYAALSGVFEPKGLLKALGTVSTDVAVTVTADLADACDTAVEGGGWLMRGSARQRVLDEVAPERLRAAIEWRRRLGVDAQTEDLLAALVGEGPYDPDAILHMARTETERTKLEGLAVALDRAGQHAPAHGALDAVRSALGRVESELRYEAILGAGFFGRAPELLRLEAWVTAPTTKSPVRAVFVTGLPGIGKSTLVEEASRRAARNADRPSVVVRFDFDRGGLDVQDLVGLTLEFSRQVAIALGEDATTLSQARIAAAGAAPTTGPSVKGETLERVPEELAAALGEAVGRSGRPLLVILDTMEVLRGRGETHPERLFRFLDQLVARRVRPTAVLAAGRGDALDSAPDRLVGRIELAGLEPTAADEMLRSLDVPDSAFAPIRELAEGNPLVLRLAALTAREAGAAALEDVKGRKELAAAYLYRFLLSRIDNAKLRSLAEPGLIVRRINPEVIGEVLVPALGLPPLAAGEAAALYEALASHHWLVEPDAVSGWVRHRADIRRTLLRLLYEGTDRARAARVDRAAAKWFSTRPEPFAAVESAYHQLQAMRTGSRQPVIDRHVLAQLDDETLAELNVRAQDLVRSLRGQRTSKFREAAAMAPSGSDLVAAAIELEALLERGDLIEARHVHDRSFSAVEPMPGSREADVHVAFLWRSGRWAAAARIARTHTFLRVDGGVEWWRGRSPATALAQLEIWAEIRFADAVRRLRRDPELARFVMELCDSGVKGSLANGALGFALLAAGIERPRSTWNLENPMEGAVATWSVTSARQRTIEALSGAVTRFEALVSPAPGGDTGERGPRPQPRLPNPRTPRGAARLLATSMPYGSVAEALRRDGGDRLLAHLSRLNFEVAERGGLPPSGAGGWAVAPAVSPDGVVENLTALGLLAESLGAAAFVARHTDLRQVAARAERWRRTTAGDWAYPTKPIHDAWARRPDATIADRIARLMSARDPVGASLDQLALWWSDGEADVLEHVERRARGALREARFVAHTAAQVADERAVAGAVAVALLERNVPSAFVPALTVLISTERTGGGDER